MTSLSGIYLHIPFCKQACNYCNFHFVTSLQRKNELLEALLKETEMQSNYLANEVVDTIYFGGGTPSLLQISDIRLQIEKIAAFFKIDPGAEITIEANPDDITEQKLVEWKEIGINRLSIGIQSFFEEDLKWMNRAHNAEEAVSSLDSAVKYFQNITIDLIYGTPFLTDEKWQHNVEKALTFGIPHLSCYALTVEPKTPLQKLIAQKKSSDVDPDRQSQQFLLLMEWLEKAGYEHYEISNFAKPGFRSRHNSSYWQGKKYLGLGPSAHSFDGNTRQWNISNNTIYIENINNGNVPFEKEILTDLQKMNEYIMTALRTSEGIDLKKVDEVTSGKLQTASRKYIDNNLIKKENEALILTKEGRLLADWIAADLFFN